MFVAVCSCFKSILWSLLPFPLPLVCTNVSVPTALLFVVVASRFLRAPSCPLLSVPQMCIARPGVLSNRLSISFQ